MTEHAGQNIEALNVEALVGLIDYWWANADQPTIYYDGVEHLASVALARFLAASGVVVTQPSQP